MEAEVTVGEIMTREYVGVSESDTVGDATDLMLEEAATSVVVLRGTEPVGTLTRSDALALAAGEADPGETPVREAMSGTIPTVEPTTSVVEAAGVMADAATGSLLVEEGGELVGVVSERDVVRATATLADHAKVTASAEPDPVSVGAEARTTGTTEGEYSTQSVCENCGTLTPSLHNFNGQLICDDCREV